MAQTISIGSTRLVDLLKAKLGRELRLLKDGGFQVDLEESPAGQFTFLAFRVTDNGASGSTLEEAQNIFKHFLADSISDIILNHWENILLKDIIKENYYYFAEDEKDLIYSYALQHINRDGQNSRDTLYWLRRKGRILQKLLDFLHNNNRIVIEGFIRFRLKEYIGELKEAADRAVDDFLIEREYREFVQLLKYFVDIQESKIDTVHVLINDDGVFKLFDDHMQPVRSDYMEGYIIDFVDNEINYEDLLISALITIAPKEITLHYKHKNNLRTPLDTIKNVFTGRVKECRGCRLCASTH
ncbi:MAG: YtxC-like family protein [Firmicutes bacterium ADurb.Bin373]|nr:putative sporulation protein YtxC [Bacillota bacterium]OQA06840.1 MAG: YtxC-like family protein [Firmicutes bacterium ADurb.Bin373]